jgi:hypothetical protein
MTPLRGEGRGEGVSEAVACDQADVVAPCKRPFFSLSPLAGRKLG